MMNQFWMAVITCLIGNIALCDEPYMIVNYKSGGFSMSVEYGCGQSARYQEPTHSLALQTNKVNEGVALTLELDRRNQQRPADAISLLRSVAPPIVVGNPCPQPYCAPSVCTPTRASLYQSTICHRTAPQPSCASPCNTSPRWCSRTNRWCTTTGNHWCSRTNRWCNSTGDYWCTRTNRWCSATAYTGTTTPRGSCCSGGNDGRNAMVHHAPGVEHDGCHCRNNPNGPGNNCGCDERCPECNTQNIVGLIGYNR
jgi:hypothetical protein